MMDFIILTNETGNKRRLVLNQQLKNYEMKLNLQCKKASQHSTDLAAAHGSLRSAFSRGSYSLS